MSIPDPPFRAAVSAAPSDPPSAAAAQAAPAQRAPSILLIDDDQAIIRVLAQALRPLATLHYATNGQDALRLAAEAAPDVILLDAEMPGLSGLDVLAAVKASPQLANVPVIIVTAQTAGDLEERGLELGAADFIAKPVRPAVVVARVRTQLRLKWAIEQLEQLAFRDGLTGVANRRSFDATLRTEAARAARSGQPLSLLLIDVDHFKAYNDRYGHPQGDACLIGVARALQNCLSRPGDQVCRFGGEEFAVLLPAADTAGAATVAARAVESIRALGLPHAGSPVSDVVTVSIGAATLLGAQAASAAELDAQCAALLARADAALYAAKQAGRNQARSG